MTAKERVRMVRLLEKLEAYPAFGKALGIQSAALIRRHDTGKP